MHKLVNLHCLSVYLFLPFLYASLLLNQKHIDAADDNDTDVYEASKIHSQPPLTCLFFSASKSLVFVNLLERVLELMANKRSIAMGYLI